MADDPKDIRIPFMISEAELDAIDTWRHEHRVATRAEAIRHLVKEGLRKGSPPAPKRPRSYDGAIGIKASFKP